MNADLLAQKARDHMRHDGADALTEIERTVLTAWLFEAGVDNDGFANYYRSHRADLASNAPSALREIGAADMAALAAEANGVFGPDGPPTDFQQRRERVRDLSQRACERFTQLEQRFDASEEDIDALLEVYLAKHGIPAV